ncbi:MAG: hypothetical protein ACREE2_02270 [Stellaceae bacterium]
MTRDPVASNIDNLVRRLDALPIRGSYGAVKPIIADVPPELLRSAARFLAENFEDRIARLKLPVSVVASYREDVCRIHRDTGRLPDHFYRSENDVFIKDFCIAAQRIIPVGAQIIHETGISRRFVLGTRGREAVYAAGFFLRTRGFSPFYEMHTHEPALGEFNDAGWRRSYLRIAAILKLNPEIKGVFSSAWYFDPVIEKISPRLAYVRNIPMRNGALSIYCGSDEASIRLATKTSETRRKLHSSGRYLPTSYLVVWDRHHLLQWAAAQSM